MIDGANEVRSFIVENFLYGDEAGLTDDTSFLEDGIVDSTGILELVAFLEEKFSISVGDEELIPANLDTLNNIGKYLERKKNGNGPRLVA